MRIKRISAISIFICSCFMMLQWAWAVEHHHFSDIGLRLALGLLAGVMAGAGFHLFIRKALSTTNRSLEKVETAEWFWLPVPLILPVFLKLLALLAGLPTWMHSSVLLFYAFAGGLLLASKLSPSLMGALLAPLESFSEKTLGSLVQKPYWPRVFLLAGVLVCVFVSIMLSFQYWAFGKGAFDFGIHAGVAWKAIHQNSLYNDVWEMNYLGDHFSPIVWVAGLFLWLAPSGASLLFLQTFSILATAIGLYWVAHRVLANRMLALVVGALYLLNPFVHQANAYELHTEVIFGPLLIVLNIIVFEMIELRGWRKVLAMAAVAMASTLVKEDMLLVLTGYGAYLFLFRPNKRWVGLALAVFYFGSFLFIAKVAIPYFAGGIYMHIDRYQSLGSTPGAVVKTILTQPWLFFVKASWPSIFALFKSTGFIGLLSPTTFLPASVPIFYNGICDFHIQNEYNWQYSYPLIPFVIYNLIFGLKNLVGAISRWREKRPSLKLALRVSTLVGICFIGVGLLFLLKVNVWDRYRTYYSGYRAVKGRVDALLDIRSRVPQTEAVAAPGDLQEMFFDYRYSGFADFRPDSFNWKAIEKCSVLIFPMDRIPTYWDEADRIGFFRKSVLPKFKEEYSNRYFIIYRKI